MSKKRKIHVRAVPQEEPDLRKLARAIIDLAIELNEQERQAADTKHSEESRAA